MRRSPVLDNLRVERTAEALRDNIFAMESGPDGDDPILAFTKRMSKGEPELQFD
jgi:hypothetical protein